LTFAAFFRDTFFQLHGAIGVMYTSLYTCVLCQAEQ